MHEYVNKFEYSKELINAGKYEEALNILKHIKKVYGCSENTEIDFEIAKIFFINSKYNEAAAIFKVILKKKFDYNAAVLLAKSYLEQNFFRQALKALLFIKRHDIDDICETEINDLILHLFNKFKRFDLAVKFSKNCRNKTSYDIRSLYYDCLHDMISRNIAGESLSAYSKSYKEIEDIKIKNACLNEYEIYNKQTVLKSKPRRMRIYPTNKCNMQCKMCRVIKEKQYSISDNKIKEIISFFPYLETIIWSGGEAFLYDGFTDLIDIAKKYSIKQSLSTNTLLIDENRAEHLFGADVDIDCSVDGIEKDTYENIRIGGRFDQLIKKLDMFRMYKKESKSILTMQYVISKYNCHENFTDVVRFAADNGFSKIVFSVDHFADKNTFDFILNKYNGMRKEINCVGNDTGIEITSYIPCVVSAGNKCSSSVIYEKNNDKLYCTIPWKMITVDINGIIRSECFCHILGDLKEHTLEEIWNGDGFVDFRNNILLNNKICDPVCYNSNRNFN